MDIKLKLYQPFMVCWNKLKEKYGEQFERINGFHNENLNFSDFIDHFTTTETVADATIDANANSCTHDVRTLMSDMVKPHTKLLAYNKIFYELTKTYGLETAEKWLEGEWNGAYYLHDAATASFVPYCFSGETKVLTRRGIKSLESIVDQDIETLNKNGGWEKSTVKKFGIQPLRKLTLERYGVRKEIFVTPNHIWFVNNKNKRGTSEINTDSLVSGMTIPFNTTIAWHNVEASPFGIAHGFFTGDGDKSRGRANFCGDKIALLPYFTPANVTGDEREYSVFGVPNSFKELPLLTEPLSYLYGWLSGYFAADGSVDERGRCTMSSTKRENLELVRDVLCILGMPVNEIRSQNRVSNLTNEMGTVYILTLSSEYLRESFFIRPTHKERFIKEQDRKNRSWTVVSVEETDRVEETYCVVAPETQSFTLDGNVLTHNCYAYDVESIVNRGLFFINKFKTMPPKHLTTYNDHILEFVSWASNRTSGAVGLPSYLVYSYYFWYHDVKEGFYLKDPEYYRRQCFQKFIYDLNQPYLRVTECAFTNISVMDRNYLVELFGGRTFPDGEYVIDHIDGIIEHQKVFMEVVSEIRHQTFMTFPVLSYSLLYKDGKFVDEDFARWCNKHNMEWYDSNFYVGSSVTSLSNCCRLISDTSKLDAFINSIGGTSLSIGSIKVNTINLRRIALESDKDEDKYIEILHDRVDLCLKVLATIRKIITRNVEKGLLPNYTYGLIEMEKQYCTIGITAMYEAMNEFGYIDTDEFGYKSYSDKAMNFAKRIMSAINEQKDSYPGYDFSVNVECIPAERANVVLCEKDNLLYPNRGDYYIYSNQWIPLVEKCTINEKIRLGASLDKECGGGNISHINVEGKFANEEQAWELLNHIAASGVIYFAYNTKISVCKNEHGFFGDVCPQCGEPVADTYSRVVGFLTARSSYSKQRKKEFDNRKWYSIGSDI